MQRCVFQRASSDSVTRALKLAACFHSSASALGPSSAHGTAPGASSTPCQIGAVCLSLQGCNQVPQPSRERVTGKFGCGAFSPEGLQRTCLLQGGFGIFKPNSRKLSCTTLESSSRMFSILLNGKRSAFHCRCTGREACKRSTFCSENHP